LPFNLGNHQDSCDVIGFVSQFFSSTSGALSSTSTLGRHSSCADDGRVGTQRSLPRAKAHGRIPSHLAVSGMTMRILRAKESWLIADMGQERHPYREWSLTSSRNSINTAMASALWYRGFCSSIDRSAQGGGGESDAVASELRLGWRAVGLVVLEEIGLSSLQWDPN
jgi:hypothetical protein